jgi:branched-chain amino acid transport system substrate-binding protein
MIRKIILWSIFLGIAGICVVWFSILILNTLQKEKMRYGVARIRAERAATSRGPVEIGVAGAEGEYANVYKGIALALEEINRTGGVNGRMIKLISRGDEGNIITGRHVAQQFSDNLDMVAVIGHMKSEISVPVSVIYQYYGMLMISPLSTSAKLTAQGHNLIFRTIPGDLETGKQMAEFVYGKGYKNISIFYQRDEYGMSIATSFENNAAALELNIVDRLSYENRSTRKQFRDSLRNLKKFYHFDAIFLAGKLPQAAMVISEARQLGIRVPIIADESLNSDQLIKQAGGAADGTIVMSIFDVNDEDPVIKTFRDKYIDKYKKLPDLNAAQGYDSLKLLVFAMKTAKSTVPSEVAAVLHNTKNWKGITGLYSFDKNGDVVNRKIGKRIVKGGRFVSLTDE